MIGDNQGMWSIDQTLAQTASTSSSTNVINLGDAYKGEGNPIPILLRLTAALVGATATLQVKMITDDNAALSSPATIWDSGALAVTACVLGYTFLIDKIPPGAQQYVGLTYTTAVATTTAGAIWAGIVGDVENSRW